MFLILNIDTKWAHFVNKTIRKVIAITDFCQNELVLKVLLTSKLSFFFRWPFSRTSKQAIHFLCVFLDLWQQNEAVITIGFF